MAISISKQGQKDKGGQAQGQAKKGKDPIAKGMKQAMKGMAGFQQGKDALSPNQGSEDAPDQVVSLPGSVAGKVKNADLGGITVIKNSTLAKQKQMVAVTKEKEIHIAPGHFKDAVLLHEVAHFVQMKKGRAPQKGGKPPELAERAKAEQEAEDMANQGMIDGSQLSAVAPGMYGFQAIGDYLAGQGVSSSHFVEGELQVGIELLPYVPNLFVTGRIGFNITAKSDGTKELTAELGLGVRYDFCSVFQASFEIVGQLKLQGANLGDAFVDAMSQTIKYGLNKIGALELMDGAYEWAQNHQRQRVFQWDSLIPYYGAARTAQRALENASADVIKRTYPGVQEFLQNNPDTGFELSIGVTGGIGFSFGRSEDAPSGEVTAGARVGLVDDVSASRGADAMPTEFAEFGGEFSVSGGLGGVAIGMTYRKERRKPGVWNLYFNGELDVSSVIEDLTPVKDDILLNRILFTQLDSAFTTLNTSSQNAAAGALRGVGGAIVGMSGGVFTTAGGSRIASNKIGLDISVSLTGGKVSNLTVSLKSISSIGTPDEVRIPGGFISASLSTGTVMDISSDFGSQLATPRA